MIVLVDAHYLTLDLENEEQYNPQQSWRDQMDANL